MNAVRQITRESAAQSSCITVRNGSCVEMDLVFRLDLETFAFREQGAQLVHLEVKVVIGWREPGINSGL